MSREGRIRVLPGTHGLRRALLVLVIALSGCSALQLGYNNADKLLQWRADQYFGFEGEAQADFERRMGRFLSWHRRSELPLYAVFANQLADRLARGVSLADLVWGYDSFQTYLRQSLRAGTGEIGDLLDALSAAQVDKFQQRLDKENRDFAKEHGLREGPDERRARRVKRNVERMEEWFGPLTDAQVERIAHYSRRAPLDDELRNRDRIRMQEELLAMLKSREAAKRLVPWAAAWDQHRAPAYETLRRANLQEFYAMLLDLDKTLTLDQRARAVKRLRGFAADLTALAAAPAR